MTPTDSSTPTPKPKRPLRRLALVFLFIALALLLTHATWAHLAQRRLDARLRHLHEAGEPVYPADFATPALPAGQNPADDLAAASVILKRALALPDSFEHLQLGLPLTPDEVKTITDTLAARADVLALADAAAAKPQVRWDADPNTPSMFGGLPGVNGARGIANLLRADALLAHQQGRDDHALRRADQILRIARHVDRQPAIVSHITAAGIAYLAAQTVDDIGPDLRIGSAPGHVPAARVREIVDQLLDDQSLRAGMLHALRGDLKDSVLVINQVLAGRMPADAITAPPDPSVGLWAKAYALKPIFLGDADTVVRMDTAMIDGFKASPDFPAYVAAVDLKRQFPEVDAHPAFHFFSRILVPSGTRAVKLHYRILTDRHLAAAALAIRAYAADHANQFPPTLDALVPTCLPAVPTDPLAPAGAKLHYLSAGPNPILYSVGEDSTDDGGDQSPAPHVHPSDDRPLDRWEMRDAVLHLTRQPRYVPPPEEIPQP